MLRHPPCRRLDGRNRRPHEAQHRRAACAALGSLGRADCPPSDRRQGIRAPAVLLARPGTPPQTQGTTRGPKGHGDIVGRISVAYLAGPAGRPDSSGVRVASQETAAADSGDLAFRIAAWRLGRESGKGGGLGGCTGPQPSHLRRSDASSSSLVARHHREQWRNAGFTSISTSRPSSAGSPLDHRPRPALPARCTQHRRSKPPSRICRDLETGRPRATAWIPHGHGCCLPRRAVWTCRCRAWWMVRGGGLVIALSLGSSVSSSRSKAAYHVHASGRACWSRLGRRVSTTPTPAPPPLSPCTRAGPS